MGVRDIKIRKEGSVGKGIITEETAAPFYQEMVKKLLLALQTFIKYPF